MLKKMLLLTFQSQIIVLVCIVLAALKCSYGYLPSTGNRITNVCSSSSNRIAALLKMSSSNNDDNAASRRQSRRKSKSLSNKNNVDNINSGDSSIINSSSSSSSTSVNKPNDDGTSNLEDLFGLGNDQLRELMEQQLPVPREDLVTRKAVQVEDEDKNKVFRLPDLGEFMQKTGGERESDKKQVILKSDKIDRKNRDEYLRALQLNPFADADDSIFLDEYDIIASIAGSGKLLNIPVPYLQTGHGILLIISVIAAFIYAPGNPLTEFPPEIRTFLQQGLAIIYGINFVLAIQSYYIADSKNLPGTFWAIKTFLIGGIAFYEINQAKDPDRMNDDDPKIDPSIRKSRG